MVCYYHVDRDIVGTCPTCGKGLCVDCYDLTIGHVCYDCSKQMHANAKKQVIQSIIWTTISIIAVIVAIILMTIGDKQDNTNMNYIALLVWFFPCFYPAWKLISIKKNGREIWCFYDGEAAYFHLMFKFLFFVLKAVVALIVSFFIPVIYLVRMIINIINYKKIKTSWENVEESQLFIKNQL